MHARRARPPRFGLPFVEAPAAPAPTPAGMPACLSLGSQRTTAGLFVSGAWAASDSAQLHIATGRLLQAR